MRKRFLAVAGVLALLAMGVIGGRPLMAREVMLFVQRTRVASTVHDGRLYAPAAPLLRALGCQWSANGTSLALTKGDNGGPDLRVKTHRLTFSLPDGKSVTSDTLFLRNELWVQVKPLAQALGGMYRDDSASAGIVQVFFTTVPVTQRDLDRAVRNAASSPPSPSRPSTLGAKPIASEDKGSQPVAEESGTGTKEDEKDPIVVDKVDFMNPIIPGSKIPAELRGTATIKNTSDQRVTNVRFTVELHDLGGHIVANLPPKFLTVMEPGETASQDFLWYNYYNQSIEPKVKIEHDPLPKKKKKKDDKAGGGSKGTDK